MKITIIIYTRLFILFPNLIAKESYNWWVTRRVWGFRHQISKAKYLKISKTKYLKISQKCRSHISGSFRRTLWHCAKNGCETLRVSAISGSEYVWPGKLKRSLLPSGVRIPDVNIRVEWRRQQNSGCGHPGGMSTAVGWNSYLGGNELWFPSGWNEQDPILLVF